MVDVESEPGFDTGQWCERLVADGERHAHALLVRALLRLPAMRAPRVAVVRRVDDEGVVELPDVLEGLEQRRHGLVDGLQGLELLPVEGILVRLLRGTPRGDRRQPGRFVGHVGLVVVRGPPRRDAREAARMAGSWSRRGMRGLRREVKEEGLLPRRVVN